MSDLAQEWREKLIESVAETDEELMMKFLEGEEFSVKEVARILDISEGAVQKRLARARAKLKKVVHLEEIFI